MRAVHAAGRAPPLPPPRASRPHLALFLAIAGRDAGRIVVEIFEDVAPAAAALLRDRCAPGAAGCFAGAAVARLLPGLAAFVGGGAAPRGASAPGVQLRRAPELRHGERGAVSLRLDGGELCLLLAPAPHLDATHQVVGRVAAGMEVLDKVDAVGAARDDQPCQVSTHENKKTHTGCRGFRGVFAAQRPVGNCRAAEAVEGVEACRAPRGSEALRVHPSLLWRDCILERALTELGAFLCVCSGWWCGGASPATPGGSRWRAAAARRRRRPAALRWRSECSGRRPRRGRR